MNIPQLEAFVMLAETEHMTKTAKLLNTSQPNLSYNITELEKEIGVPLFKKVGRNIKLTKYGHIFYEHISQALAKINQAQTIINEDINPNSGNVNFGFVYTVGSQIAPRITRKFLEEKDNNNIKFTFLQGHSRFVLELLTNETIDIGISSKVEEFTNIEFTPLFLQDVALVVPINHPLAKKDEIYLKETADYPYVFFNKNSGLRPYLDTLMKNANFEPNIVIEANEDHTILGFVAEEHGITIMPDIITNSAYPVKVIKILDNLEHRWLYLATRKDSFLSPAVQKFKKFCLDYFRD